MDDGKLCEVLIEDKYWTDERTGVRVLGRNLNVWADAGMKDEILKVKGVSNVFVDVTPTKYDVWIDPRYDREWVKAEIEAAIKCR